MKPISSYSMELMLELMMDIDRGKIQPLTSTKNIEAVLVEVVDEYEDYQSMLHDLTKWGYIKC